jgi:hypothetical protein
MIFQSGDSWNVDEKSAEVALPTPFKTQVREAGIKRGRPQQDELYGTGTVRLSFRLYDHWPIGVSFIMMFF